MTLDNLSLSYLVMRYPEILLSLASFFLIYLYRCLYRSSSSVIPINWPLIGMLPGLVVNSHDFNNWVAAGLKEAGGNILFKGPWFTGMDAFSTCDPANINHILSTNFPNYIRGQQFCEVMDTLGDGITASDGDSWAFQRRVGVAFMSTPKFRSTVRGVSLRKVADGLLPILDQNATENCIVDLCDVFLRFSFDLAFIIILGVDPGSLAPDLREIPFARALLEIENISFCRFTTPRFWWKLKRRYGLGEEKRLPLAQKIVDDLVAQCIKERREESNSSSKGEDVNLLSSLLELGRQDSRISDKFLRDSVVSYINASRDNGGALSWFFWLLSMNPRVEKKILEELSRLKPPSPSNKSMAEVFKAEEADELVYLHAAIYESLRLYPPLPYNYRLALKEDVLPSGHKVSAGQHVFISMYAIARMEGAWGDDCLEFRPERWIDEGTGMLRHEPSYKFLTFHCGPRSCLGKNMAMVWMKMAVAAVMYNFEVEVAEGHVVEPALCILLQMKHGLWVRVKKRVWTS